VKGFFKAGTFLARLFRAAFLRGADSEGGVTDVEGYVDVDAAGVFVDAGRQNGSVATLVTAGSVVDIDVAVFAVDVVVGSVIVTDVAGADLSIVFAEIVDVAGSGVVVDLSED
jgi:hypothetical protein